jgi:integrase
MRLKKEDRSVGRKTEYRINHRGGRNDYWIAIPDGQGGRERIHGETREAVLERLNRRMKERRERPNQDSPLRAEMTLAQYVEHFLKSNDDDLEKKTLRTYVSLLQQHVLPFRTEGRMLRTIRLCDIRRRHLKALIIDKRRKGYAPDTVRLTRAAISMVLTDAVDDELIPANPALRLLAKARDKEQRMRNAGLEEKVHAMDGETLGQFLAAARAFGKDSGRAGGKGWRKDVRAPIFSGLFISLAKTGMRPSEALALTPFDVKFGRMLIRVSKAVSERKVRNYTKSGAARNVEMSLELADELRNHMAVARHYFEKKDMPVPTLLFPSTTGSVLDVDNAGDMFNDICASAGIQGFTLYDLRHTYASLLLMRGAKPQYVQQQLGHETLSTTLRYYAHWIPKEVKESYAKLIDARAGENPEVISVVSKSPDLSEKVLKQSS